MSKSTPKKSSPKVKVEAVKPVSRDFLDKLESHFAKRHVFYFVASLATALVFSLLLFNARITDAVDDALYLEAGYNYAKGFFSYFYTATAPLYCMFLALPIAIFGLNLIVLKLFSVLFFLLAVFVLYRTFRKRIPYMVLFPALFLTAVNSLLLYYASQTYSEMFFLLLLSVLLLVMLRLDDATENGFDHRKHWLNCALLGLLMLLLYLSRNVAMVIIVVAVAYFVFFRKYKVAGAVALAFSFFYLLYQKVILPLGWGHLQLAGQHTGQMRIMFQKDAYNAGMGQETLGGFVVRFFENAKIYSSQFFDLLSLKTEGTPHSYFYAVALWLLVAVGVTHAYRNKQKALLLVALVFTSFLGATFISLHTSWGQARLIMIYLPFIAMVMLYGIIMLLKIKRLKWLQWLYMLIVALVLVDADKSVDNAKKNMSILQKNLSGNMYAGFTPDWVNYFKMSEWVAKNLPQDVGVACRKAPMSFIYSKGRSFSGISGVPSVPIDSLLNLSEYQHRFLGVVPEGMSLALFEDIRPNMTKIVLGGNSLYYVYDLPEERYKAVASWFESNKKTYFVKPDSMIAMIKKTHKSSYAVSPDGLLGSLRNRKVQYVIDASLRMNPAQKTGDVISTISRYLYFIENKYPNTFEQVQQIGGKDDEPSMLYKVHYPRGIEL